MMLKGLDEKIYTLLNDHVDDMPMRFVKMIAYYYTDARIRKKYWKRLGVSMGEGTFSNLGMVVTTPQHGDVWVEIGDHVSIAPHVSFICSEEANNGTEICEIPYVKEQITREGKIIIKDNVWIGANVTILSGVTVGKCTVIGAGSVVLHDLEPYSIYAGVPARKIRALA